MRRRTRWFGELGAAVEDSSVVESISELSRAVLLDQRVVGSQGENEEVEIDENEVEQRQLTMDSQDHSQSHALKLAQPSPLRQEAAYSPDSSSAFPSSSSPHHSQLPSDASQSRHEQQYVLAKQTEAEEDASELQNFRRLALERQKEAQHAASQGSAFEPFVGSRVGSPIPDAHGLGWPGA